MLNIRAVPIWVFGMYRYPICIPPKEADNRSIFALQIKVIVNLCKSVHLPTIQQHVDIFIAHSMPVVMVAWVSIVQSRQLVTHNQLLP